jgi:hypothetical protein
MDVTNISLIVSAIALLISIFVFFQLRDTKEGDSDEVPFTTKPLQLQAYERLVLLCERIALPNLISRVNQPGLTAREMQLYLIETIKQEYEYNASQQIYVSTIAWDAVRNLHDQNMLVINQIANVLPPDSRSSDLNKKLLELIMQDDGKALHSSVLETLNFEAKRLIR